MKVMLFRSRNKDNRDLPGFKERSWVFFTDDPSKDCDRRFRSFVQEGVPGEFCRCYLSVNERDMSKVKDRLICALVMDKAFPMDRLESEAVSIAMKAECAAEHKWLFDFDIDNHDQLDKFLDDLRKYLDPLEFTVYRTPHGWAVIADHGFDTREIYEKWGKDDQVTLKRDDMICYDWATKEAT